ncbi:MAG TPA: BTAD domain-containing putative transcriptional regulator [Kofleriaceae bacterium]|nr:BTAD domain-containing putative transcriptional regulator [Kofleriaceae bacterium]
MTPPARTIRVLGPAAVHRGEVALALPRSRKVRALLGYLALSSAPLSRSRLCDLLWDVPNDPRGELRWCLSKLRGLLDDGDRRRVVTGGDLVSLDLGDCQVDAVEVERLVRAGLDRASPAELAAVGDRFAGDLLDGTELDGGPEFTGWLAAQRNRYRSLHVLVLQALTAGAAGSAETFRRLDTWLQLAPFDPRAHEVMLDALVRAGRHRDAEDHLARAVRAFEHEGVDGAVLRAAWQRLKGAASGRVELTCEPAAEMRPRRRASVAIMPFTDRTGSAPGRLADGLTEDIIMQLAKLRVLFVIARGTVFALAERGLGAHEAGQVLGLDYVTSGTVARDGDRLTVTVELTDTRDGRIVWTDKLHGAGGETFAVLDAIVQRIVAAIAEEIEAAECQRAVLKPPGSLDAWEAYHRGLWHMYKFNGADNRHAEHFFRSALALDPTFDRAHAGLSFTHFQNAFLDFTPDRDRQIELAFTTAGHSLGADAQDPSAHWAMGRALWLRGVQDEAFAELERSVELSPNFALGHYTLGFVHAQKGDPATAIEATNYSRRLSPFDPLQFAMLASRAMAHVRLDQRAEAADWAV